MLPKPLRVIWGDLTAQEIKKFGILASIFFLVMGVYWMLKTMKDPIFDLHVGFGYQPRAKMASVVVVALVLFFYNKLVDLFKKPTVFYIVCFLYGAGFVTLSYFLANPHLIAAGDSSFVPGNIVGWVSYLTIESFGSTLPALFWAFVASTTTADSAKRGYPMIATCTQVGTIIGPWLVGSLGLVYGLPIFFTISGLLVFCVPFMITFFNRAVEQDPALEEKEGSKPKTGFTEGLRLVLTKPYLMGVFAVATFYEFIGAVLDFQKGMLIAANYPSSLDGGAGFAWFKSREGIAIGVISLLFALFGTSFFLRRLGLRFCLISFPATIGVIVTTVFTLYFMGANPYQLMWVFFGAVVVIKGLNYTLNNPTREVLYIPTSRDVKFKAKGWIDAFGARLLKTFGSILTENLRYSAQTLLTIGTFSSLGLIGVWLFAATYVGTAFDGLQKENKIVE